MAGIVIIGAGECGARAAFALRENGYQGPVTLIGAEPHAPYERPPLSKEFPDGLARLKTIAPPEGFAAAGITLGTGTTATAIDRANRVVALNGGTAIGYDSLLLATGARPRRLPQAETAPVLHLRTVEDSQALLSGLGPSSHLAIIGGGFIGLEVAATARSFGARVTIIETMPRLLSRAVLPEIADLLAARHRTEGVDILCSAQVTSIGPDRSITLGDGTVLHPSRILVGIGAVPETALAEAAGLVTDNGIAVNEYLQTSDPLIFAAGDCCSFPSPILGRRLRLESWRNAQDQGSHAAANMAGPLQPYATAPWFWSDQYDLTLQIAGHPDPSAASIRREISADSFILFQQAPTGALISASGIGHGNSVAKVIRLAEKLIAGGIAVDAAALADSSRGLKSLLRGEVT